MTRDELLKRLRDLGEDGPGIPYEYFRGRDREVEHKEADKALLAYINDPEITAAFDDIDKWYA